MTSAAEYKYKLMLALSRHVSKSKAISMEELFKVVYGGEVNNKVNDTRKLRKLIEGARRDGLPICSIQDKDNAGYYLAAAGTELDDYCKRLRKRALKLLVLESKLRQVTLPNLVNEISFNLDMEAIDESIKE